MTYWPSYNQYLVRRGERLFAYDFLDAWDSELARMNENKEGKKKYRYPNSFILIIGYIRVYFHLPYRQTDGIIKATGENIPNHPSYGQICRRLSRLDIDNNNSSGRIEDDDDYGDIVIAIDSTGIKVTNRGQWLRDKWNISEKADGSYDSNKNFKYLYEKKILPGIKIRKNSITSTKNTSTRNKEVTSQQQQYFGRWKKKRKYGHRWMA